MSSESASADASRASRPQSGSPTAPLDARVEELEILSVEQSRTIEALSDQLADQWKAIDALRKQTTRLLDRLKSLEERAAEDVPSTPPPHY